MTLGLPSHLVAVTQRPRFNLSCRESLAIVYQDRDSGRQPDSESEPVAP